jgi:hypothetical protein
MPAAYSADIRGRVIASVESGSSRREAAEEFDVSASSAIKWVAAYRTTGSCAAKPRGGSTSPLEKYANFLLTLIEGQPDLTLDETIGQKHGRGTKPTCNGVLTISSRNVPRAFLAHRSPGNPWQLRLTDFGWKLLSKQIFQSRLWPIRGPRIANSKRLKARWLRRLRFYPKSEKPT